MDQKSFDNLANQGYNRIPVVLETFADLDSPLSIYLKLANEPYSYFLESVQGGERFSRYSFIGLPTTKRISVSENEILHISGHRVDASIKTAEPLAEIRKYLNELKVAPCPVKTRFSGGLVGYFGYETIGYLEKKLTSQLQKKNVGAGVKIPEILLLLSEELAIVDNLTGKLSLVVYADPKFPKALTKAKEHLVQLLQKLRSPVVLPESKASGALIPKYKVSKKEFMSMVESAKKYILDGDIFQVVLSHPIESPFNCSPLTFYRALRSINPSPYMYYFNFEDFFVVGASPEILVRLQNDELTVRPIAGTRKRGSSESEDLKLEAELKADEKECAEHMMLLDLGRNDAGRICESGTVQVTEEMTIERYSHVMHMVSNVQGKIKAKCDSLSALSATFPAGTVSGAPKVRALEIIAELEKEKREIYAGAVGYLGFNGDMDLAIALRTAIISDNTIRVQAGAGIVADSVAESEWDETVNKAKALFTAAQMAIDGLDTSYIE